MMKNIFYLASILIFLSSCGSKGDLDIVFKGIYVDEPLVFYQDHDYDGDQKIRIERSEFYISNLELIDADGTSTSLSDVELINLEAFDLAEANEGHTLSFKDIDKGSYSKLRFGIGLSSDLNATSPADHLESTPLGKSQLYWDAWNSYIFSKLEGSLDPNNAGSFEVKYLYHTGTDPLYREKEIVMDIAINNGKTTVVNFDVDHKKIFEIGGGAYFDIENTPINHDPNDLDALGTMMDNFVKAIK